MNRVRCAAADLGTALGLLLFCALAAAEGGAGAAPVKDEPGPGKHRELFLPRQGAMQVGLDILVDSKPLRTVAHHGRTYLPVPQIGTEYQVRVWNNGPRRIAAIVSVDGLSVINGKPASGNSPGYLVDAHSDILIKGWRRDMDRVAAFSFVDRSESYAKLIGRPENIGVIGLLAIEERVLPPVLRQEKDRTGPFAAKSLAEGAGSIGTGYGRDVGSQAYYVPFVRSSNQRSITLYYDTEEALRKAGVLVDEPPLPRPFPGLGELAPPPPGYKGR